MQSMLHLNFSQTVGCIQNTYLNICLSTISALLSCNHRSGLYSIHIFNLSSSMVDHSQNLCYNTSLMQFYKAHTLGEGRREYSVIHIVHSCMLVSNNGMFTYKIKHTCWILAVTTWHCPELQHFPHKSQVSFHSNNKETCLSYKWC
jgi:hypothetical protein